MQGLTRSTVLSLAVVVMDDGEICLPPPLNRRRYSLLFRAAD